MIPVGPKPEPKDFDHKVRQKGWEWLKKQKLDKNLIAPKGTQFEPYWRECFGELWESYEGICAYTSMFFRRSTGAGTTEHFAPKSLSFAGQAYEWSNYRLACRTVNSKKSTFEDVLDPFELTPETFF